MVLLGCGDCLALCGGYPRTFVVPMAWTDWKWVLRLMSLHVRLGVLFPRGADTNLRGTPEVLLGVARWIVGPSLVLARSRGGILISRWGSDLMVLLGCGECLDLCGGYPRTFVVPTAWTD